MKTYEEMAHHALERIGEYEAEQKKRRKTLTKIVAPAVSVCLLAALCVGVWRSGLLQPEVPVADAGASEPDGSFYSPGITVPGPAEEVSEQDPAAAPVEVTDEPVISDSSGEQKGLELGAVSGSVLLWWNNSVVITGSLNGALEKEPDGEFAILAVYRPTAGDITSFTYEGKTLSELAIAADEERILPEKMTELLKLGEDLKYGTALCETGNANGELWSKQYYEDKVAWFGEALLGKYIADGVFYREALERDIAEYSETAAREAYKRAYRAYLDVYMPEAAERLTEAGIPCARAKYMDNGLTFSAAAEELENLPLDDLEYWTFDLDLGDRKDAAERDTDSGEPTVVN